MPAVSEDLRDRLRSALGEGLPLRLASLFGSAARGRMHASSDDDVGIVPVDPELSLRAELEVQARLELACGRSVDLVRLDRASPLLRWRAALEGVVPVEGSPVERKRFVAEAAIEHAELAPAFERALDLQDAIALSLLVAIQEAVDIAFHVAVDEG